MASDLVSQAFVYGKKNPITGFLVCADVVLKNKFPKENIQKLLRESCSNLQDYKIPAIIKVVDRLEMTSNGKIKRS